jgi:hypothetical protein
MAGGLPGAMDATCTRLATIHRSRRITLFRRGLPGAAKGTSGGKKGDFRGQFRGLPGAVWRCYKEVKKFTKNKRNSRI